MKTTQTKLQGLWGVAVFLLAGFLHPAAVAALVACAQDCSQGACLQVDCQRVTVPGAGGSCRCSGGADPWGETTFASWCIAWGVRQPTTCAPEATGGSDELANATAMMQALRARNLYVATLVVALQDGPRWISVPAQGLFHETYDDPALAGLSHAAALSFSGQVIPNGLDSAQIDLAVNGDIRRFVRLKQASDAATPTAVPPCQVHGSTTSGGLHGSLLVSALDGTSETLSW